MFQRTYDGKEWEEVSEKEARARLGPWYKDVDLVIEALKSNPDYGARTMGCYYRWVEGGES